MACPPEDFRAHGLERRQAQFTFDLFENPLGRDRLSIASATFDALPIGVHDAGSRSDIEVCIRPSLSARMLDALDCGDGCLGRGDARRVLLGPMGGFSRHRSEDVRVGKGWVRTGSTRWSPYP